MMLRRRLTLANAMKSLSRHCLHLQPPITPAQQLLPHLCTSHLVYYLQPLPLLHLQYLSCLNHTWHLWPSCPKVQGSPLCHLSSIHPGLMGYLCLLQYLTSQHHAHLPYLCHQPLCLPHLWLQSQSQLQCLLYTPHL